MKQRSELLEIGLTGLSKAALCKGTNPEETVGRAVQRHCAHVTIRMGVPMMNQEENGLGVRLGRWNLFMQNRNRWW